MLLKRVYLLAAEAVGAEALAADRDERLRVRLALVEHRGVLRPLRAVYAGAVGALRADEMLNADLVADDVDADPVRKVAPLPRKLHQPDRRMLGEQNFLFPCGGGIHALIFADGIHGGVFHVLPVVLVP